MLYTHRVAVCAIRAFAGIAALGLLLALSSARQDAVAREADRRVALVIGNSAYQTVEPLRNPVNDARAIADGLRESGFEVIEAANLDYENMQIQIKRFLSSLEGAGTSVFYYSGHGIQVAGENRLIPVDAELDDARDLEVETFDVELILKSMQQQSRVQLIFLDACRNNPFPAKKFYIDQQIETGTTLRGFESQESEKKGSLIGYSTDSGNVAQDGEGELSPYAEAFVEHAFAEDVELATAMTRVRNTVSEKTAGRQTPWELNSLLEPVVLNPSTQEPAIPVETDTGVSSMSSIEMIKKALGADHEVPIGVGPVALATSLPLLPANDGLAQVRLANAPITGQLSVRRRILKAGSPVAPNDLLLLRYEPQIGTENVSIPITWSIYSDGVKRTSVEAHLIPRIEPCDREAGEPLDLQGVTAGRMPQDMNPTQARKLCEAAVAKYQHIPRFAYQLGRAKLAACNIEAARPHIEAAAASGHIRAIYRLGYMKLRGLGEEQNLVAASRLFARSAENSDPYGMYSRGRDLMSGWGGKIDTQKGINYLTWAAELGSSNAMNELGAIYYYGEGVPANPERAIRFYQQGLEQKSLHSLNNLGLAYLEGVGVETDFQRAFELFKTAADGGHSGAANNVGRMYFEGLGVEANVDLAMEWYERATSLGDTFAASNLAWIYLEGPEAKRDKAKAAEYYAIAVALDVDKRNDEAKESLRNLDSESKLGGTMRLLRRTGGGNFTASDDPDTTLVSLARLSWFKTCKRTDMF